MADDVPPLDTLVTLVGLWSVVIRRQDGWLEVLDPEPHWRRYTAYSSCGDPYGQEVAPMTDAECAALGVLTALVGENKDLRESREYWRTARLDELSRDWAMQAETVIAQAKEIEWLKAQALDKGDNT